MKFIYHKYLYLFLLFFLGGSTVNFSQSTDNVFFTNFNHIKGFPTDNVSDVTRDRQGFVWLATNDGLLRYDSDQQIKEYRVEQPAVEGGLRSNTIRVVHVDKENTLWIGTTLGGLTRYNQSSGEWTTFLADPNSPSSLSNNEILAITEDRKGRIWVGTEDGLNLFQPDTDSFQTFTISEQDTTSLHGKAVLSILEDDRGWIWVGTWDGGLHLMLTGPDNEPINKFRRLMISNDMVTQNVWKIYQDHQHRYWIGTGGGGLYLMKLPAVATKQAHIQDWEPSFYFFNKQVDASKNVAIEFITDILQDSRGDFWVATTDGLLSLPNERMVDIEKELYKQSSNPINITLHYNKSDDMQSICNKFIWTIHEDSQGLLWFGTAGGVSQYSWYSNQFANYQVFGEVTAAPKIDDIYKSADNVIYIGTDKQGLLKYDLQEKRTTSIPISKQLFGRGAPIKKIYSPDQTHLYLAGRYGIERLNLTSFQSIIYPLPSNIKEKVTELRTESLFKDSKGNLWVGTDVGLHRIDEATGAYTSFFHNSNDTSSISDNSITEIVEDARSHLWISTYNGLNEVDLKEDTVRFKHYRYNVENPINTISSNQITALNLAGDTLYIGTRTGLCVYDYEKEQFTNLSESGNRQVIQSIELVDGAIWASTTAGILHFDPSLNTFQVFDKQDGLAYRTYLYGASSKDQEGNLFFASPNGIIGIRPDELLRNETAPAIFITDIVTISPEGEKQMTGIYEDEIVLEHDDYYLSLTFSALNYIRSEKNQYAYFLEGFDQAWHYTNDNQEVVYTNLDAGTYQFRVKAANNNGVWNEEGKTITIIKRPAFWQTWWFLGGNFLLGTVLVGLGFRYYTKKVYTRNQELEVYNENLNKQIKERKRVEAALQEREQHMEFLVKQRTQQLDVRNTEVKALLQKLKKRNEELEEIVAARTQKLRTYNQELKRSNNDLEQFAYTASHDLQAPLRTIISFSQLLKKSLGDKLNDREQEFLKFILSSTSNMQELIDALLTFSRVNSQKRKVQAVNPTKLLTTIEAELNATLKEEKATLHISDFPEAIQADKIKLKQLLQNLITNGVKFCKKGTDPIVKISCEEMTDCWQFQVKDNGIGISEEFNEKIFSLFRRLHTASEYKGTGIGLALCKKIVEQHEGKIWVESEIGEGSNFIFTISKNLN